MVIAEFIKSFLKQRFRERSYYSDSIKNFRISSTDEILGKLTGNSDFAIEQTQRDAWVKQIEILQNA